VHLRRAPSPKAREPHDAVRSEECDHLSEAARDAQGSRRTGHGEPTNARARAPGQAMRHHPRDPHCLSSSAARPVHTDVAKFQLSSGPPASSYDNLQCNVAFGRDAKSRHAPVCACIACWCCCAVSDTGWCTCDCLCRATTALLQRPSFGPRIFKRTCFYLFFCRSDEMCQGLRYPPSTPAKSGQSEL